MAYCQRVQRNIEFIEKLKIPSGVGVGGPFKLRAWQKRFINKVYGPQVNGLRVVRRAIKSVGRKNGKTTIIAALVLLHLVGPEQEWNGEIYSAANEREQAALVYKVCTQIIKLDPELEALLKIVESTKTIVNYENGSVYRAISAEASSKFGYNPTVVIYDELASAKNRALFDALDTSMGAREEPLFIVISTQSNDPDHILSQMIDDGIGGADPTIVVDLYAVDEVIDKFVYCAKCSRQQPVVAKDKKKARCSKCGGELIPAIYDPACWKDANPALGDFRSLVDFQALANRARRMPGFEPAFRNLYLNMRTDAKAPLIPRAEWEACQGNEVLKAGEAVYLGLDLSATTDLCALVAVSDGDNDVIEPWFWKPLAAIKSHERKDHVPYQEWVDRNLIIAPEGRSINYGHVAMKIAEIRDKYDIKGISFDRWRIEIFLKEMEAAGIDCYVESKDKARPDAIRLVPFGQGFKDMAPAIDALENSILDRRFVHSGHPVLTWNFSNAIAITDPAGNRKLDKSKARFRIDGAVATVMAKGLKAMDMSKSPKPIERGFIEI